MKIKLKIKVWHVKDDAPAHCPIKPSSPLDNNSQKTGASKTAPHEKGKPVPTRPLLPSLPLDSDTRQPPALKILVACYLLCLSYCDVATASISKGSPNCWAAFLYWRGFCICPSFSTFLKIQIKCVD